MLRKNIDIGINLASKQFLDKRKIVIESKNNGIVSLVLTGTTYQNCIQSIQICKDNNDLMKLYCTIGVHPHNAKEWTNYSYQRFRDLIQWSSQIVVAIGECGLDYNRNYSSPEQQIKCFKEQIQLAQELDLPLFLHERDAFDDFHRIIENENQKLQVRGVVHCFTSGYHELVSYLELGMYIGITGWICDDRRNYTLIDAIKRVSENTELRKLFLDRVMIETDAPFLSPVREVKPNHPRLIVHVLDKLADVLNISSDELALLCYSNTIDFFGIKRDLVSKSNNVHESNQRSREHNEKLKIVEEIDRSPVLSIDNTKISYRDMVIKNIK